MTSLRSRCSRRSYRGGERLLCGKSVDRVTVLSILSGYNVISVRVSPPQGCGINKVELIFCAFVLKAAGEKQLSFLNG